MNTLAKISSPPIYCSPQTSILEASLLMKEKRIHCLLITDNESGKMIGLTTTKDLAFKAFLNNTLEISEVMSKYPFYVSSETSVNDALKLMVIKKIRHLPIVNDDDIVIGVLNITTCFYNAMIRLERMSEKSKELELTFNDLSNDSNLSSRQNSISKQNLSLRSASISSNGAQIAVNDHTGLMDQNKMDLVSVNEGLLDLNILKRKKKIINELKSLISLMKQPDLNSLLMDHELNVRNPFYIDTKTSIWDASQLLLQNNITAALIVQNLDFTDLNKVKVDDVIGILTTKDLVFRVLSCQLDPKTFKVARIMTSKPEFASSSMAVHNALRLMYEGKYLNLPIKNSYGQVTGLVNVLDLTYSLLNLLNNTSIRDHESDLQHNNIPAWNRFWDSLEKPLSKISENLNTNSRKLKAQRSSSFANLLTDTNKQFSTETSYVEIQFPNLVSPMHVRSMRLSGESLIVKTKIEEQAGLGLNGSIYKFEINTFDPLSMSKINEKINSKLQDFNSYNIQMGYFDIDDDYVLIDSDIDFKLALKSKIYNFVVKVNRKQTKITLNSIFCLFKPQIIKYIGGLTFVIFILSKTRILHDTSS